MTTPAAPVSLALARALGSRREEYNQRFAQVRRQHGELDGAQLLSFLREALDPAVTTLAARPEWSADRVDQLVSAAFDAALELCGHRLLAAGTGRDGLTQAWRELMPATLARWPDWPAPTFLAALCNPLFHLTQADAARPQEWLIRMARALPHLAGPEDWLAAGQAAAWLSGLAQYRAPALVRLARLPTTAAQQLLGLTPDRPLDTTLQQLRTRPWFDPLAQPPVTPALEVQRWLGAFRGYGGQFPQPPELAVLDDQLYVRSADACWLLLADAFGQHLARVATELFQEAARSPPTLPTGFRRDGSFVQTPSGKLTFEDRGGIATVVASSTTLAISFPWSHQIALVPLQPA